MNARRLVSVGALAGALAVLASGCLLDSEKAPVIHDRGGEINITVSEGLTPEYSWNEGGMISLSVSRLGDSPQNVWRVWGTGVILDKPAAGETEGERIVSPVHHGYVPNGTREEIRVEPRLTPGVRYRVVIVEDGSIMSRWGSVEFTPQ